MPSTALERPPHRFEIARDGCGRWIARDREGLAGGVFVTCKDAMRFALFEARGDAAQVWIAPEHPETA